MSAKLKRILHCIFGSTDNLFLKFNLSCFITGTLFLLFALLFQASNMPTEPIKVFTYISAILFAVWIITMENITSLWAFLKEFGRLCAFFVILTLSMNFCINESQNMNGISLILYSLLACMGIFAISFYLISKLFDIIKLIKKMVIYIKQHLFNSVQPATTKIRSLLENITAFLVAIAGLGVALKAIIEPLINLFR